MLFKVPHKFSFQVIFIIIICYNHICVNDILACCYNFQNTVNFSDFFFSKNVSGIAILKSDILLESKVNEC